MKNVSEVSAGLERSIRIGSAPPSPQQGILTAGEIISLRLHRNSGSPGAGEHKEKLLKRLPRPHVRRNIKDTNP